MVDIPDDVVKAARKQCDLAGVTPTSDMRVHCEHVAAFSILAERQRCADVARKEGDGYKENGLPQSAMGAYTASRAILAN